MNKRQERDIQRRIDATAAPPGATYVPKNDLEKYFYENKGRVIWKWLHYFEIYDRHLSRYRGTDVTIVEVGVWHGGSLQMWKSYFGNKARIYGIDIDPRCKQFEEDQIKVFIGSQDDPRFLRSTANAIGSRIDIFLDDGSHYPKHQITTFEELFPRLADDGVYLCEDSLTSYWKEFGGGYRKRTSFIEYAKRLIDLLNAWHSQSSRLKVTEFTRSARSMHFYDNVVVIEKRRVIQPTHLKTGVAAT